MSIAVRLARSEPIERPKQFVAASVSALRAIACFNSIPHSETHLARFGDRAWIAVCAGDGNSRFASVGCQRGSRRARRSAAASVAAAPVSPKLLRYAERIVHKYDADKSGDLIAGRSSRHDGQARGRR